jgi:hypothetical protein
MHLHVVSLVTVGMLRRRVEVNVVSPINEGSLPIKVGQLQVSDVIGAEIQGVLIILKVSIFDGIVM